MHLPTSFKATVVTGRGVGHKLGFPTLNFNLPAHSGLKPAVYAGYINEHPAAFNYGPRPTFGLEEAVLEAHLLDFSGEWGEAEADVTITIFLREIKRFDSAEELQKQILKDIKKAQEVLKN